MRQGIERVKERLVFTNPSGNNLPKRNKVFTGREEILNKLNEVFSKNENTAIMQVLRGYNGIGKTSIAVEFCYLHINEYQNIFWINAKNKVTLSNSYYDIARLLGLITTGNVNNFHFRDNIRLVNSWLCKNGDWLLVYDEIEEMELLEEYLPINYQGHILITTNCQEVRNNDYVINVGELEVEEATMFLLKKADLMAKDEKTLKNVSETNKFAAKQIIQEVNSLALGISLSGAYIEQTKCSLTDYLSLYENIKYFPNKESSIKVDEETKINNIIVSISKLIVDQISKKNIVSVELLQCCCVLFFENIAEEILTECSDVLGNIISKKFDSVFTYNECIAVLSNYSLIEQDKIDNTITVHSLVKGAIVKLINYNRKVSLIESLAKSLNYQVSKDPQDSKYWFSHKRMLGSALGLSEVIISMKFNSSEIASLFYQLGIYCQKQELFETSLDCYFLALTNYRNIFGDNHSAIAITLNNIGEVYRGQENYYLALNCYLESLECYKESFSDNHPSVGMTLANIGILCAETAREMEAVDYYKKALDVFRTILPSDHPWVRKTIRMYSNLLVQLNRNEEAEMLEKL